jgi:hypothetical protein
MFRILRSTVFALALTLPAAATAQVGPVARVVPTLAAPEGGGLLAAAREWLVARLRPAAPPAEGKRPTSGKSMCGIDPDGHQALCR